MKGLKTCLITLSIVSILSFPLLTSAHTKHNHIDLHYDSSLGDMYYGNRTDDDGSVYMYTNFYETYLSHGELATNRVYFKNEDPNDTADSGSGDVYHHTVSIDPDYFLFDSYYDGDGSCSAVRDADLNFESDGDREYQFYFGDSVGSADLIYYGECANTYLVWQWQGYTETYAWRNNDNSYYGNDSLLFYSGFYNQALDANHPQFETKDYIIIN